MTARIKSAAALVEHASAAVLALSIGKNPSSYDLAMIAKYSASVLGVDPDDSYADEIAAFEAEDAEREQREHDSEQAERRLDLRNARGM